MAGSVAACMASGSKKKGMGVDKDAGRSKGKDLSGKLSKWINSRK